MRTASLVPPRRTLLWLTTEIDRFFSFWWSPSSHVLKVRLLGLRPCERGVLAVVEQNPAEDPQFLQQPATVFFWSNFVSRPQPCIWFARRTTPLYPSSPYRRNFLPYPVIWLNLMKVDALAYPLLPSNESPSFKNAVPSSQMIYASFSWRGFLETSYSKPVDFSIACLFRSQ